MIRPSVLLGAGGLAGMLLLIAAQSANAETVSTVVQGDVVRLVSTLDTAQAAATPLGVPVSWDVAVSASRADGIIDVSLDGVATPDAYALTVRECAVAWTTTGCASGERMLASGTAGTAFALARQSSEDERWYRIDVELQREIGGAQATLTLRAAGTGADVRPAGPGGGGLAVTGGSVLPLAGPALGAIALGLLVAGIARWRRGRAV